MKIFFGEKTIHLVDAINGLTDTIIRKSTVINSFEELKKQYTGYVNDPKINEIVFISKDITSLKNYFESMFTIVSAAGGLVMNEKKEFLLIFRKGKWDLPKGKIEKTETIEVAAIREVEEECGIRGLSIIKPLPTTYHIYIQNNVPILKPTYWFEMQSSFKEMLVPQLQEGITKVEWVNKENVKMLLTNSYESIKEVMAPYL